MVVTDQHAESETVIMPPDSEAFLNDDETVADAEQRREEARLARLAQEARAREQQFYRQGVADWVAGRRNTEAALYFYGQWAESS